MSKTYYVYILASSTKTLYIGVTNDLLKRVWQHRTGKVDGFTAKYHVDRLVYFEETTDIVAAITREKQLKGWRRARKVELIEQSNCGWEDLSVGWYEVHSTNVQAEST